MTNFMDYLTSGEIVRAVLEPFVSVLGMPFTIFFGIMIFLIVVYLKVQRFAIVFMLFLCFVGGIRLSHLFQNVPHPVIPQAFDALLFLIFAAGLAFVILMAALKR